MADEVKAAAPAPAPAPAQAPAAPAPAPSQNKVVERKSSNVITNPASTEPAAPAPEKPPETLPSTTIAEMAAGRAALEKNKPVAEALEDANRKRAAEAKA